MSAYRNRFATQQFVKSLAACPVIVVIAAGFVGVPVAAQQANIPQTREQIYDALARDAGEFERQHSLLKQLVKAVGPSVAHIEAKKRQPSNPATTSRENQRTPVVVEEAGSGIVIQRNGRFYVITNYHVIEDSLLPDIHIEADGKIYTPSRLMHDRETDLSVMAISRADLLAARLGDSSHVEIGDFVVAVGSPFGLSHSVSYGIVSALERHDLELGPQGVQLPKLHANGRGD